MYKIDYAFDIQEQKNIKELVVNIFIIRKIY